MSKPDLDRVELTLAAQEAIESSAPFPQRLERRTFLVTNYLDKFGSYQFFYEEDGTYLFKRVVAKNGEYIV